jgi:hypothetical protein
MLHRQHKEKHGKNSTEWLALHSRLQTLPWNSRRPRRLRLAMLDIVAEILLNLSQRHGLPHC